MLSSEKISIQWIVRLVFLMIICRKVIYPVDSTIQRLKNWGHIILEFGIVSIWRDQKLERSNQRKAFESSEECQQ